MICVRRWRRCSQCEEGNAWTSIEIGVVVPGQENVGETEKASDGHER